MELIDRQKRYGEILGLLVKHDLAFFFDKAGLTSMVPSEFGRPDASLVPLSEPERVKRLAEALGPAFVKMGQILSTRPDLIPHAYLVELKKLQDDVGGLPFDQIRAVVEAELGRPIGEIFADVDETPLAAASIGQVHCVTLKDGTKAVIKVQRPGIEETIRRDISILRSLASLATGAGATGPIDALGIVREFERSILRELDYVVEGHATDAFRAQHEKNARIVIPRVFWETTTKRVLTLERIEGIKVSDIARLREKGHDLPKVAQALVDVVLEQVFLFGRFHADPHPGNLMVMGDGRLAMIDFGMAGHFDDYTRRALVDLIRDSTDQDHFKLAQHLLQHGLVGYDADMRAIRNELREMFRAMSGGASMAEQIEALVGFVVKHHIAFPPDLFFLDKVFGTLDGAVKTLDPKLSMRALAARFMPKLAESAIEDVPAMTRKLVMRVLETEDVIIDLPGDLSRILRRADAGHLGLQVSWAPSEQAVRKVSRMLVQSGLLLAGALIASLGVHAGAATAEIANATTGAGAALFGTGSLWLLTAR